jgi:hypothetical protein
LALTTPAGRVVGTCVKAFVAVVILALGVVTFLNQRNHHMRSLEARKGVVAIERKWGLYDEDGHFAFQEVGTNYAYAKFAGGERRLAYSLVQSSYIVATTAAGLMFVVFA